MYIGQEGIEESGNFDNPHYSFDDVEDSIERRLEEDTREFLRNNYLSRVATHSDSEQYRLTDKGKEIAPQVYKHVRERYNGEIGSLMDWENEETVNRLLNQ